MDEEVVHSAVELTTSSGVILVNLYDWAWMEKAKEEVNISSAIAKGKDAAVFVMSVTHKTSKTDFPDYSSNYERSVGYDKPWLMVSNKNDSKKRALQDSECSSLTRGGPNRAYVAISLVDDTGIDELKEALARILMKEVTLTVSKSRPVSSEDAKRWAVDRVAAIRKS